MIDNLEKTMMAVLLLSLFSISGHDQFIWANFDI